ncbi:YdeI/OmpD-associated family protein [Sphingobacterium suaedae]|uniref:YdeI family protein n=1 Tax=Sphingobacterium suaedae TaxID=1686402 RepID=A0ABW5KE88_9SPHI
MNTSADIFYPKTKSAWRTWLIENHEKKNAIWVVLFKKKSNQPTISWSDAVEEALCFGWIDSIKKTVDEDRSIQFFSKRKPKGTWSKINKQRIQQLMETGRMFPAGLASVETAKQNGSWSILDDVEELIVPPDLEGALKKSGEAEAYFLSQSRSKRKMLLHWVILAKRPETRRKRVDEIANCAAEGKLPRGF